MKKLLVIALSVVTLFSSHERIIIDIVSCQSIPLSFFICSSEHTGHQLIDRIVYNVSYNKQFALIQKYSTKPSKKNLNSVFEQGCPLALFFEEQADAFEWRLYDTTQATMIAGKRYQNNNNIIKDIWADIISQDIWTSLTGEPGPFMSCLVYIKKNSHKKKKSQFVLSTYDGKNTKLILESPRICIAPAWNNDPKRPFLTFSEFTPSNVRLCGVDLKGFVKTILDVDGTCVGVSYASHNGKVLYGRSGEIWRCEYDRATRESKHKRIIKREDSCSSPTVLENGDIIYGCLGGIYYFHNDTQASDRLTEGYCVGPVVVKNYIVYSKRCDGIMQLCVFNVNTKQEAQITFDRGDKIDPTISPCAGYIACTHIMGKKGRIMIENIVRKERHYITPVNEDCAYPSWSGHLDAYIFCNHCIDR